MHSAHLEASLMVGSSGTGYSARVASGLDASVWEVGVQPTRASITIVVFMVIGAFVWALSIAHPVEIVDWDSKSPQLVQTEQPADKSCQSRSLLAET
jgi:hypothetical protein